MNMKPTVKILVCVLAAGSAWAQNPSVIQNTRNTMNAVSNNTTAASDEALGIHQSAPPAAASHTHAAVKANAAAVPAPAKVSLAAEKSKSKSKSEAAKVSVVAIHPAPVPKASVLITPNKTSKTKDKPRDTDKPSATQNVANVSAPAATEERAEKDTSLAPDSKYAANGRRDPFLSPVVSRAGATSCNSGKKCLEIGTINLRGVVHGESGFIAVVSNGLNKAYFLRENDPVFNGYVMKITGDSIVFQETLQDRLGKSFTREVVKKITTPAV